MAVCGEGRDVLQFISALSWQQGTCHGHKGNKGGTKTTGSLNRANSLYQCWEFCLASLLNISEYEIPQEKQEKFH